MPDAGAMDLAPPEGAVRARRRAVRRAEPASAAASSRGGDTIPDAARPRAPDRVEAPAGRLGRLRSPVGAADLLAALPLLLGPALVSWAGVGRIALAILVLGLLARVADHLDGRELRPDRPPRGAARGPLAALAGGWAPTLGLLALALLGALALGVGFAVVAGTFLAVQSWRAVAGARAAALSIVMLAAALVLRVDAGAVALGTAPGAHVVLFVGLFGLFAGLCRHRERLLRGSARAPGWLVALVRRYLDVVTTALLCGLIVGYVVVLGRDPVLRTAGAWVYLSAPFVLAGLLRYWHLAVVEERPVARGGAALTDPWLALSALGAAAALGVAPHL